MSSPQSISSQGIKVVLATRRPSPNGLEKPIHVVNFTEGIESDPSKYIITWPNPEVRNGPRERVPLLDVLVDAVDIAKRWTENFRANMLQTLRYGLLSRLENKREVTDEYLSSIISQAFAEVDLLIDGVSCSEMVHSLQKKDADVLWVLFPVGTLDDGKVKEVLLRDVLLRAYQMYLVVHFSMKKDSGVPGLFSTTHAAPYFADESTEPGDLPLVEVVPQVVDTLSSDQEPPVLEDVVEVGSVFAETIADDVVIPVAAPDVAQVAAVASPAANDPGVTLQEVQQKAVVPGVVVRKRVRTSSGFPVKMFFEWGIAASVLVCGILLIDRYVPDGGDAVPVQVSVPSRVVAETAAPTLPLFTKTGPNFCIYYDKSRNGRRLQDCRDDIPVLRIDGTAVCKPKGVSFEKGEQLCSGIMS